jgi:hypothetical protein
MSAASQADGEHVLLATLWKFRTQQRLLSTDEILHIVKCDQCLSLLGLCSIGKSIEHVERLRDESD